VVASHPDHPPRTARVQDLPKPLEEWEEITLEGGRR